MEEVIVMVQEAIEKASKWQESGWPAAFGVRQVEVSTLKEAEKLPRNAVYRDEAIYYWRQVRLAGQDTSEAGKKALEALKNGRLGDADDALYLCQYLEKPFEFQARTWLPVFEAFRAQCCP